MKPICSTEKETHHNISIIEFSRLLHVDNLHIKKI